MNSGMAATEFLPPFLNSKVPVRRDSLALEKKSRNPSQDSARQSLVRAYTGSVFLRNVAPLVATSFRVGSMRRQMAAARAMTFTSVVKDSMTTSPL